MAGPKFFLFSERDVYQELFAGNIQNIAERTLALPGKFQRDSAFADAQILDMQEVEPIGKNRIHYVELLAPSGRS